MHQFRILSTGKPIIDDYIQYVKEYKEANPQVKLLIGCDSQNARKFCAYVVVIAFRNDDKGAHVIYTSLHVPKIRDKFTRLWKEAEQSILIADQLRAIGITVDAVELDFNKSKSAGSNMMIGPAVGYVVGMGYNALAKPDELIACKAADHILRH